MLMLLVVVTESDHDKLGIGHPEADNASIQLVIQQTPGRYGLSIYFGGDICSVIHLPFQLFLTA
jgi:hypothetical protein